MILAFPVNKIKTTSKGIVAVLNRNCKIGIYLSLLALSLAALWLFPAASPAEAQGETRRLKLLISSLGSESENISPQLNELNEQRRLAAAILVRELHPIKRQTYYEGGKTAESKHIIACLRALRYLTGQTFSAKTKSHLSEDERQFLDFDKEMHDDNPSHKIHFFSVWMSRNADFVAPLDAQQEIIKQWRSWLEKNGDKFRHTPVTPAESCMDSWYWYG